ncbi:hypothetical protein CDD82_675 [Ophiocordyceps australis]|uniref:Metallo-beta-lactamase domain-containing protein n=1 Tax=Ophiocordyceps australis TaxID=1399860 RepID=A0A2C5ZHP2_9HYPO|nr:hypothetical protein CDD82_675 [Ophiocordyceps australis]
MVTTHKAARLMVKSYNICAFEDFLERQRERLPSLANVQQLSPRVLRVLGQNPGQFTFQGTNTYIVGTGRERLIIDTSAGEPAWAQLISSTLQHMGVTLSQVLLTHWHGDHTGGVPDLVRMYPHVKDAVYKNDPDKGQRNICDGQVFRVEGATVRALHVPGHAEDHMCFLLDEEQAMFTGDNILGHGSSVVYDLGTFTNSLRRMHAQRCATGYPAHGDVIANLPAKIASELAIKLRRERQVLQALQRDKSSSMTVRSLVNAIYSEQLDEELRTMALEPFVHEVLRKLAGDGKVAFAMRGGVQRWYAVQTAQRTEGHEHVVEVASMRTGLVVEA